MSGSQPPQQSNYQPLPYQPTHWPAAQPVPYPQQQVLRRSGVGVFFGVIAAGLVLLCGAPVIIALVAMAAGAPMKSKDAATNSPSPREAKPQWPPVGKVGDFEAIEPWVYAQKLIEKRLKSPKTAEFPDVSEIEVFHQGDGRFRIRGFVDSQNEFSAMIRTQFVIELRHLAVDDKEGWIEESFERQ